MSIGKIMSKIVRSLPKTEGATGRITMGRTQLEALGSQNQNAQRLIHNTLDSLKNPKLDVAYKAESNYAIAGMRLRDGKKVIGQGAVSITNPGSSKAVVKYRASADGGTTLQANGFIDAGKAADGKDIAIGMSRKGGKVTADTSVGQATRHHIEFDEQNGVEFAKQLDAKYLLEKYNQTTNKLQQMLNGMMDDTRKVLKGEVEKAKPLSVKMKQADVPHFNKEVVVDKNFKKIAKSAKKFSKEEVQKLKTKINKFDKKI